jgi:lipoprotein-anchoring transpeptidase ErfK/SrfK
MARLPRPLLTLAAAAACSTAAWGAMAWGNSSLAQDLVGCQLVDGTLQCIPGVTESPQLQIQQLDQQISNTIQQEAVVQQRIDGLQQLVLSGNAAKGQLLTVAAQIDAQAALPQANYHWYRLQPGTRSWVLIEGANGTTYVPGSLDVGQNLMVVVVVNQNGQVKRVASTPVGPVQP